MINLAGNPECDNYIEQELKEAGVEWQDYGPTTRREVPSSIIGCAYGWLFTRAWYYWVAKAEDGVVLPFDLADELYEQNKDVRVAGHCGAPAPREWYRHPWHVGVSLYHVDTQEGLNLLVQYLTRHAARQQRAGEEAAP